MTSSTTAALLLGTAFLAILAIAHGQEDVYPRGSLLVSGRGYNPGFFEAPAKKGQFDRMRDAPPPKSGYLSKAREIFWKNKLPDYAGQKARELAAAEGVFDGYLP